MNIDRSLNLVVPVDRADGTTIYVHASAISREAFDANFLVIAKTFTAIYAEGLGVVAGPRIAAKMLKKVAADMGQLEVVQKGLLAEMSRLTNVIAPGGNGWTSLPVNIALDQKMIDADDVEEVENAIAFFTLASAMHKKREARGILEQAARLWSALISSSNATEYAASLSTSMTAAGSGAKETPSSIPS